MTSRRELAHRFAETFAKADSEAYRALQREVFGAETWVRGYTTPAQADLLAQRLALGPSVRLLDVGAGQGWPGLYLARKTGCQAVLTDVPQEGLRNALIRAERMSLRSRCAFFLGSGTHLPFRPGSFDAVVHTDAL